MTFDNTVNLGGGNRTITLGTTTGNVNLNGAITNGGVTFAATSDVTTGMFSLGGTNTYSGATSVGTTVELATAGSLSTSTAVTMTTGGRLELRSGTAYSTSGAFTLNGTAAGIDFNGPAATTSLTFADSSAISWTGNLVIYGWNGNFGTGGGSSQLFFGNSASALTPTQLSQITFDGFTGSVASILSTGEVVPIPEPFAVLGVAAAGLGLVRTLRQRVPTPVAA
jgi:hypothetical protein